VGTFGHNISDITPPLGIFLETALGAILIAKPGIERLKMGLDCYSVSWLMLSKPRLAYIVFNAPMSKPAYLVAAPAWDSQTAAR